MIASAPASGTGQPEGTQPRARRVVLAYSGGLDTSVILRWLKEQYDCEIVTFTADLGQREEVEPARAKAQAAGVKEIYIDADMELVETAIWVPKLIRRPCRRPWRSPIRKKLIRLRCRHPCRRPT